MTAALLEVLGRSRLKGMSVVFAIGLVLALLPVALLWDGVLALVAWGVRQWVRQQTIGYCDGWPGHRIELVAVWTCGSCGLSFHGHVFADACPHCFTRTHAVNCPCGRVATSPLTPMRS